MALPHDFMKNVLRYKMGYLDFRSGVEGSRFEEERRGHEAEIKRILSRENLERLDEGGLIALANNLYAFMWWAKKEYLVDYWIRGAGGLDKLRHHLKELLYSDRNLAERFDEFRRNVRGIGVAMITEMLTYFNPREYGIWNRRVREALLKLGLTQATRLGVSRLTGKEYSSIIGILREIANIIRDPERLPDPDLLDVHYFLYYVLTIAEEESEAAAKESLEHEDIVNMLLSIGRGLGFDALREVSLAAGARVDVVWLAKIGNLGELRYVFEVHVKGSIDSLLLNLMKASQDPAVQKVIAVADKEELEKIRRESSALKMLSDKLVYWDVMEVERVNELIEELMDKMRKLGLTKL